VIKSYKNIPATHVGKASFKKEYDFSDLIDVKEYVLEQLRVNVPQYINIHLEKKPQNNNMIIIGGGQDGITYRCSVKNQRNQAFVEIYFSKNKSSFCQKLKLNHELFKAQIDADIVIGKLRIGVYFTPMAELKDTVIRLISIFEKMIVYFTPITFPTSKAKKNPLLGEMSREKENQRVPLSDIILDPKEWLMLGPELELLAEEVDNERSLQALEERLVDYLS
jgi:hypothetical protein